MRQILQNLNSGATDLVDVPAPGVRANHLLIQTRVSLISAGTERMLADFGKANLVQKVRQQPDKVRQVLEKMRTDGVLPTLEAVQAKLNTPLPLGYCNVGVVIGVGPGVSGFAVGDRVLSNGPHAEIVAVPHTLCAKIPDGVDDEAAAFAVLGAIGLQGIRLAKPTLGEAFVVAGLGLIGLLTVQLLRANGCRVLGIDMNAQRLAQAREWGAEVFDLSSGGDPVAAALAFSRGQGVDGVVVTAATKSSEPMHQAAQMCRKRGRIVLVGVTGLNLSRADFYEKELSFQVSCSYGPGRYDPEYEAKGQDYPFGFVRWTEQRNFEAVLDAMEARRVETQPLVSHRFDIDQAGEAYATLDDPTALGILLRYHPETAAPGRRMIFREARTEAAVRVGIIGAGNYATRVLGPAFREAGAEIVAVAANGGASAAIMGRGLDAAEATTDVDAILNNPSINTVVVATPHGSHAKLVLAALRSGKHVFVEKPLALTLADIAEIESVLSDSAATEQSPLLTVGFNRRAAPLVEAMTAQLSAGPKSIIITVNAGAIPAGHWTQDAELGGGRIAGEACHFIDLARHIAKSPITSVSAKVMGTPDGRSNFGDTSAITLSFADGSIASVTYFANGSKAYPKERIEVFDSGRIFAIDNFKRLAAFGGGRGKRLFSQNKGQSAFVANFVAAITNNGPAPIDPETIFEVARATLSAAAPA